MTTNNIEFWQISILTDTNKSILLVINKNESVKELFKKFLEKYRSFRRQSRLTFLSADGSELDETDDRRLADVDFLRDKCNIRLIVHAVGGGWPTEEEIEKQRRDPSKVPTLTGSITNDLPDMMGMYDDSPRVKMSCGHAIAPTSLALYCCSQLDNGAHSIHCPDCSAVWSFKSVIDAACLSLEETNAFEQRMISNALMNQADVTKECPGCGNFIRRLKEDRTRIQCMICSSDKGRKYEFCWTCLNEWRSSKKAVWCGNSECGDHTGFFECLENCKTITLNGIKCPSRRACPECLTLIEHKDKCKHMKCPSKRCKYDFCFICLQHYPCETGIMGAHKPCTLAPRQDSTSLCPPAPTTSDCVIL